MYIEIDSRLKVNLMDMDFEEAVCLAEMIRGAGLQERRAFNHILRQLEQPIDKLMKT